MVKQAVYYVSRKNKIKLLTHLLKTESYDSVLVFSRTKHGADKIVRLLRKSDVHANAIHGNKSQNARQRALGDFKSRKINILIATDIAARGIDVQDLSLVINYDLPNIPETYIHRIGRTGRAKASGIAISFCDGEERAYLRDIQKLIDEKIPIIEDNPFQDDGIIETPKPQAMKHRPVHGKKQAGQHSESKNKNRQKRRRYYAPKKG
jgi:ATP-dependent RNA helicase RhlE